MPTWTVETIGSIVEWFLASPLVAKPVDSFESFTIISIPEHLGSLHLPENYA